MLLVCDSIRVHLPKLYSYDGLARQLVMLLLGFVSLQHGKGTALQLLRLLPDQSASINT